MLARRLQVGLASSSGVAIGDYTVMSMGSPTQSAVYKLVSDGTTQGWESGIPATLETWLLSGTAGQYEARATVLTGSLTSGTTGSWLSLGTTRDWYVSESTPEQSNSCTLFIEIRLIAGPSPVLASATIELNASAF